MEAEVEAVAAAVTAAGEPEVAQVGEVAGVAQVAAEEVVVEVVQVVVEVEVEAAGAGVVAEVVEVVEAAEGAVAEVVEAAAEVQVAAESPRWRRSPGLQPDQQPAEPAPQRSRPRHSAPQEWPTGQRSWTHRRPSQGRR